jgi:hypothetical protein
MRGKVRICGVRTRGTSADHDNLLPRMVRRALVLRRVEDRAFEHVLKTSDL